MGGSVSSSKHATNRKVIQTKCTTYSHDIDRSLSFCIGHQDSLGIIAAGDYEAAFDSSFLLQWKSQLRAAIESIHRDFSYELEQASQIDDTQAIPEERIALDLHIEYLNHFFESVGPATAICSHATCFCCLMDVPEHPLPCGHVLCTACIKAYGKQTKSLVALTCCPLHRESTKWSKPALVKFKPAGAGVRILSLDGGGIRGIVQLEVLRAIEQSLGGYLPIQSFFDLIVGTGTGGMLGVALSMKDRTVDSCIDMFSAVCDHAFTPRLKGVPIISHLAQIFGSGPRYKTKPLYAAVKTAFSEDNDLFGSSNHMRTGARVALTSTSVTGRESILLASYRRPEDVLPAYSFERPHEPDMELKIWESVAAALATPGQFRPFNFHAKTYLDGGLRCPNPAFIADRERRLIWPDVVEPDLFLSLGTGQNRLTVLQKLSDRPKGAAPGTAIPQPGQTVTEARKASGRWRTRRIDDVLDAEIAWTDFRAQAVRERSEAKGRRFIRFNPDLDREPPAQDSKSDMESLQVNVRKRLQTPHRLAALRNVAHRLVASSFYLDLQSKVTAERTEQVLSGVITCRFEDSSLEMCALGKVLEERQSPEFEAYFLIKPDMHSSDSQIRAPITMDVIRGMTDNAVFGLPNVYIPLRDDTATTSITLFLSAHDGLEPDGFPISGFPRVLLGEPATSHRRRPTRESLDQHRSSPATRRDRFSSDGDSISLNGYPGPLTRSISSEESWQDTQAKMSAYTSQDGRPKMSLADLIAQHQNSGSSIRQRTNRFWTYIGNNHMAQNPQLYTSEDLAKYAGNTSGRPTEMSTPSEGPAFSYMSPDLISASTRSSATPEEVHELEAREARAKIARAVERAADPEKVMRELEHQREVAAAQQRQRPTHLHPSLRPPIIPSVSETESDEERGEDDDGFSGVAEEVRIAQANPVVQVRLRNSLDSILSMYNNGR